MTELITACAVLWEARVALALSMGLASWMAMGITTRRPVWSVAALALPLLLAVYLPAVLSYLAGLSTDSLAELTAPDWREVVFYFSTLRGLIQPLQGRALLLAFALMALAMGLGGWACRRWRDDPRQHSRARWALGLAILSLTVVHGLRLAAFYAESDREIASIRENFRGTPPVTTRAPRPLHVVVYIGESTTVANMQVYGYPRATTPNLSARLKTDSGLLRFDDALSTHTHTSPSLMDALSFKRSGAEVPIYERHYSSLVGVLKRAGVQTALISNQGQHGTWNIGGSVVFADVDIHHFSVNSRALGNSELKAPRPFDHDVFASELPIMWKAGRRPQVVFLHSYAGHGPYLNNIPPAFRDWSDDLTRITPVGWVGDRLFNPVATKGAVLDYDRAVRYIDASVDGVLDWVQSRSEPVVTLYFSDHGESPWTGRGHDSSKVLFEMLRVPLLMHFNGEARAAYPELFERFRAASTVRRVRTLDEIAPTVVELLGLDVADSPTPSLADSSQPGSPVVLLRRMNDGLAGVVVDERHAKQGMLDQGDPAELLFRENRLRAGTVLPTLCHHRANTLGRARRAAISSGCMEFDVAPGRDGIEVFHPPKIASGLRLSDLLNIAAGAKASVWIDTKDLPSEQCQRLTDQLGPIIERLGTVLIELPPDLSSKDARLDRCAADWRAMGAAVSYYVPTDRAKACAGTGHVGPLEQEQACAALRARITEVRSTGWITDLSLDVSGSSAVTPLPEAQGLRLNMWGLSPAQASKIGQGVYRFLLIDSASDPNGY